VDYGRGGSGIGIKTGAKLLQGLGTLGNVLATIGKVPGAKQQEALRASAEKVLISRKLVTLDVNVQLELDWKGWRLRAWNAPRLLEHFKEWGFRSFADQVRALGPEIEAQAAEEEALDRPSVQGELFPFGENVLQESVNGQRKTDFHYHLVNAPEKFQEFLKELRAQERFAVDLETTGIDPNRSKIVGLAFSWKAGEAWYLALRGPEGEPTLDPEETLHALAEVLENPSVGKVNQNIKYDLLALRRNGVTLAGLSGDPMLADYLLHAGERSHSLADLASRYFNHRVIPISDLIGKGKSQLCIDQVPAARVAEYSGEDADFAWRLSQHLEPKLRETGLDRLYDEVEVPLIEVLAELEYNGIRIDASLLRRLSQDMAAQLAGIEQDIHDLAGRAFNIASPKQLRQVLFD